VRDFSHVEKKETVDREMAHKSLDKLDVDHLGLDNMDRRILKTIIKDYGGGPVGADTLAVSVSEETETIEDVYELYLIQIGFINRTPRGRMTTPAAKEHLKKMGLI
jgi:holliday junction DNA helicase RuvB